MRLVKVAAAVVTVLVVGVGCGAGGTLPPAGLGVTTIPAAVRPAMPTLSGRLLDGRPFSTAQWRGQVVAVNFWGSWCGPCRTEAPALQAAAEQVRGAHLLGVDIQDTVGRAQAFRRHYDLTYPSLFDESASLSLLIHSYPLAATPTTYVVDRHGRLAAVIYGATSYRPFLALLQRLVAGSG